MIEKETTTALLPAGIGQQSEARAHLLIGRRDAVGDPAAAVVGIARDEYRRLPVGERVGVEDPQLVVALVVRAAGAGLPNVVT